MLKVAMAWTLYHYKFTVKAVKDGDTVQGDLDLGLGIIAKNITLRLNRIDAPEVKTPAGAVSAKFLVGLLEPESPLVVQTHKDKSDKYGRLLADLWLGDRCLNDVLVEEGHAKYWNGQGPKPLMIQMLCEPRKQED